LAFFRARRVAAEDNPIMGVAIGLGLAIVISVVVEKVRSRSRTRAAQPEDDRQEVH
jgi:hypothetical protein